MAGQRAVSLAASPVLAPLPTVRGVATAWQEQLARLGIVQLVEQAARGTLGLGDLLGLCDEIGWLNQTRMRAFLRDRAGALRGSASSSGAPEARTERFGGPSAVVGIS